MKFTLQAIYGFCRLTFGSLNFVSYIIYVSGQGLQGGVVLMLHIFKVDHILMMVIAWNISILFMQGSVPIQGLSCPSMVSSHSVGLICVNVGLVRVS